MAVSGAIVSLEHRFFGDSVPSNSLTVENLRFLTVNQTVQDFVYFAQKAQLPFDKSGKTKAENASWIMTGCSGGGSLAAHSGLIMLLARCSGLCVVTGQNLILFEEYCQKKCSWAITQFMKDVDEILFVMMLNLHGMSSLVFGVHRSFCYLFSHSILSLPFILWRGLDEEFGEVCDEIENLGSQHLSSAQRTSDIEINLSARTWRLLAKYYRKMHGCSTNYCVIFVRDDRDRAWNWILINEPLGDLISCLLSLDSLALRISAEPSASPNFQTINASFLQERGDAFNNIYKGWDVNNTTVLMISECELDMLRSHGVTSEYRPGGPRESSAELPIYLIPGAGHYAEAFYLSDNYTVPGVTELQIR
ncbi:hypothetical protein B0J14DRAFT_649213 [Halenospora varia]|nr:hypothetical protein B0J14DRAFT_649213 [Halenospora varia]